MPFVPTVCKRCGTMTSRVTPHATHAELEECVTQQVGMEIKTVHSLVRDRRRVGWKHGGTHKGAATMAFRTAATKEVAPWQGRSTLVTYLLGLQQVLRTHRAPLCGGARNRLVHAEPSP